MQSKLSVTFTLSRLLDLDQVLGQSLCIVVLLMLALQGLPFLPPGGDSKNVFVCKLNLRVVSGKHLKGCLSALIHCFNVRL